MPAVILTDGWCPLRYHSISYLEEPRAFVRAKSHADRERWTSACIRTHASAVCPVCTSCALRLAVLYVYPVLYLDPCHEWIPFVTPTQSCGVVDQNQAIAISIVPYRILVMPWWRWDFWVRGAPRATDREPCQEAVQYYYYRTYCTVSRQDSKMFRNRDYARDSTACVGAGGNKVGKACLCAIDEEIFARTPPFPAAGWDFRIDMIAIITVL